MVGALEKPADADELYLARGDEVPNTRPLMTGDVVSGVNIPGVAEGAHGMLVTHPCSMRADGVSLVPQLHVARVEASEPAAWSSCPRDRMPLPDVYPGQFHVVRFDLIGMVQTDDLEARERASCMSQRGINLLQQRLIWYFTRFVAPTKALNELFASVFEEVDLQEEWVEAATGTGIESTTATRDFHDWIRGDDATGVRRQERLKDPQARAAVRRELKASLDARYGAE